MSLAYSRLPLDRCSNERKDTVWLNTQFNKATTLICPINDGLCLFELEQVSPVFVSKEKLPSIQLAQCVFLGKSDQGAVFAIEQSKLRFSCQEMLLRIGQWKALRQLTPLLNAFDASVLALAKGLVYWHKSQQFCGLCGTISRAIEAGHARRCTECRNLTFPRTDPAVIMLVERMFSDGIARCLLGRQSNWLSGVYSTLAGFVDPGESLEMAVIREVKEETAIIAVNPVYIASQPWPFPASIMLGFTAQARSEKIETSQDSLEDAQWFSREELSQFSVNHSNITGEAQQNTKEQGAVNDKGQYKMSSRDSISAYLITAWLNKRIGSF